MISMASDLPSRRSGPLWTCSRFVVVPMRHSLPACVRASLTAHITPCLPLAFAELLMPRCTDSVTQVLVHTVKALVLVVPKCALAAFTTTDLSPHRPARLCDSHNNGTRPRHQQQVSPRVNSAQSYDSTTFKLYSKRASPSWATCTTNERINLLLNFSELHASSHQNLAVSEATSRRRRRSVQTLAQVLCLR
jgi:hypothetical protein